MWPFSRYKPKKQGKLFTSEQVRNIFKNAFGSGCYVLIDDDGYWAIPNNRFMSIVRERSMEPKYKINLYDCNRFARGLYTDVSRIWATFYGDDWPLAFAFVKVKRPGKPNHALIVQIDDNGLLHFIEPQTNMVVQQGTMEPYFVEA